MSGIVVSSTDYFDFDFQSIEATFGGRTFTGFNSIKYSSELSQKLVYGSNRRPIRKTLGQLKPTCTVEMLLGDFETFKSQVLGGGGFMKKSFAIVVKYLDALGNVKITDTILGCNISKLERGGQQGSDEIKVPFDLMPMGILWNGDDPLGETPLVAA